MEQNRKTTRRNVLKASAVAVAGTTPFFGPWTHNRVWAQAAQAKPLATKGGPPALPGRQ